MPVQNISGTVDISDDAVYSDDVIADDALFNIQAGAQLILNGDDRFHDDAVAMQGLLRVNGPLAVEGLAVRDTATFAVASTVAQTGSVTLGDAALIRVLPGGAWTLAQNAGIAGDANSRFVNLGVLQQTGASEVSTIGANLYDRGEIKVEGALNLHGDVTRLLGAIEGAGTIEADDATFGASAISASLNVGWARLIGDVSISSNAFEIDHLSLLDTSLSIAGDGRSTTI